MFNIFTVLSFYVSNPSILFIYALGTTVAVILRSGYSVTHIVPVYDGFSLHNISIKMEF
jgi:actin beta/gamma 1